MNAALRISCPLLLTLAIAASSIAAEPCVQVPRERFEAFMSQMRAQPVFRSGQIVGYRVYEFPGRNQLPALGLQQTDLLTKFCGLPVGELFMGDKTELCCKGQASDTVYVDIERNGQKLRVKSSIPPKKT